jgi:hypothetical protein
MIKRFLIWLGKKIGLIFLTQDQYKALMNSNEYYRSAYDHARSEYKDLSEALIELQAKFDEADATSILEQKKINDELMLKQDQIQAAMEKTEEYYKTVQETLSKALHSDAVYGFNRSLAFPGSTAVTTHEYQDSDNERFVVISGRTIVDDATTAVLRTMPDINSKYRHLYNYMVQYGLIDKIARMLVNSGALQFTLAYNSDCTTCEVYYNVQLKKVENQWVVDVDAQKK